jgi:hypothetical protein
LIPLFETFDFLATLKFAEVAPKPVMPGIQTVNYYDFIAKRIASVTKDSHQEADGGMNPENGELAIGGGFIKNKDVVARAAIIIHEAHHRTADQNGYSHVKCSRGEFRGSYACDPSFSYAGSYAVEVEFLARIFHAAEGVSPELKEAARKTAIHTLEENFVVRDVIFE